VRRDRVKGYESCEASVKLRIGEDAIHVVSEGDGPVNALDSAMRKALSSKYPQLHQMSLSDYKVRIIDSHRATAARTRVLVTCTDGQSTWSTVGVSSNILDASWEALLGGVEYFLAKHVIVTS
jgi:2-isopropylmalate synthase